MGEGETHICRLAADLVNCFVGKLLRLLAKTDLCVSH